MSDKPTPGSWDTDSATEVFIRPVAVAAPQAAPAGRYTHEGEIDRGGMSSILRTYDRDLHRRVATKMLSPELAARPTELERFRSEARTTAGLDHPHIPPVHELGFDEAGRPYFTMKLVEGRTLLEMLRSGFSATDEQQLFSILQVVLKACQAVAFAHSRGLVHCDLKPQNVMVGTHGQVYVMDWGIARPLARELRANAETKERSGQIEGTAAYMAPEQAQGRLADVDERTDVFGLGGILYRVLAGRAPYVASDVDGQLALAKVGRIDQPWAAARNMALPRRICDIAMKALATDPADRYSSVDELQIAIEGFLRGDVEFASRTFAPGSLIVREGDRGDAAYVILEGRCLVHKQLESGRHVLGELGPGAMFGETSIFAEQPRTASVEAVGEVKATVITRSLLEQELGRTHWSRQLVRALADRFRTVNDRAAQQNEDAAFHELAQEILRYMLTKGGGQKRVPWTGLKLHLCRRFQRTGPETTAMTQRLAGFELDLNTDELALVEG